MSSGDTLHELHGLRFTAQHLGLTKLPCSASQGLHRLLEAAAVFAPYREALASRATEDAADAVIAHLTDLRKPGASESVEALDTETAAGVPKAGQLRRDAADVPDASWERIHASIANHDLRALRSMLADTTCDVNALSSDGTTPLMAAIDGGAASRPLVSELLQCPRVRLDARGPSGLTALHVAVDRGDVETVHALVRAGASTIARAPLRTPGWRGSHALGVDAVDLAMLRERPVDVVDTLADPAPQAAVAPTLPQRTLKALASAMLSDLDDAAAAHLGAADASLVERAATDLGLSVTSADIAEVMRLAETQSCVVVTALDTAVHAPPAFDVVGVLQKPHTSDDTLCALLACVAATRGADASLQLADQLTCAPSAPAMRDGAGPNVLSMWFEDASVMPAETRDAIARVADVECRTAVVYVRWNPAGQRGLTTVIAAGAETNALHTVLSASLTHTSVVQLLRAATATPLAHSMGNDARENGTMGSVLNADEALAFALVARSADCFEAFTTVDSASEFQTLRAAFAGASLRRTLLGAGGASRAPLSLHACVNRQNALLRVVRSVVGDACCTPRHLVAACRSGAGDIIANLLSAVPTLVNTPDPESGDTPLLAAVKAQHIAVVRTLLAQRAATKVFDAAGMTPLITSCRAGDEACALALAEHGADANQAGTHGLTPLIAALLGPNPRIAPQLVRFGADVQRADDGGLTPVMAAKFGGHAAEHLLQAGATIGGVGMVVGRPAAEFRGVTHRIACLMHSVGVHVEPVRAKGADAPATRTKLAFADPAAIPHINAAEAIAPGSTRAHGDAGSTWYVTEVLQMVDALDAASRHLLLYPPPAAVSAEDVALRDDNLAMFEHAVARVVAAMAHTPVAANLGAQAATRIVRIVRAAAAAACNCVIACYAAAGAKISSSAAVRALASLALADAATARQKTVWDVATNSRSRLVTNTADLARVIVNRSDYTMLRDEHSSWRPLVVRRVLDPTDTGYTTLLHFAVVCAVLRDSDGTALGADSLEALCELAATGALRLHAPGSECRGALAGQPPGSYCVGVAYRGVDERPCRLFVVSSRKSSGAALPIEETTFETVVDAAECVRLASHLRLPRGDDFGAPRPLIAVPNE